MTLFHVRLRVMPARGNYPDTPRRQATARHRTGGNAVATMPASSTGDLSSLAGWVKSSFSNTLQNVSCAEVLHLGPDDCLFRSDQRPGTVAHLLDAEAAALFGAIRSGQAALTARGGLEIWSRRDTSVVVYLDPLETTAFIKGVKAGEFDFALPSQGAAAAAAV
jgi:hypothetical protein